MTLKTIVPVTAAAVALLGLAALSLLPERREGTAVLPTAAPPEASPEVALAPSPEREARSLDASPGAGAEAEVVPDVARTALLGTVRGPGGEPIPAAAVEAVRVIQQARGGKKEEGRARDRTGETGLFRFEGLEPGTYRVRAVSPEHRPGQTEEVELEDGESLEVEIELAAGLAIEGVVLDPGGRPVPGASVWSLRAPEFIGPNMFIGDEDEIGWALENLGTRTNARGEFRLARLPSGNRRLFVRHADWAPREHGPVAPGSRGIEVRLDAGAAIHGRVVDAAGLAAEESLVQATVRDHHWLPELARASFRARTGAGGAFRLDRVPRETIRIDVELPDGRKESADAEVPGTGDVSGIEIVVPAAAAVRGRVLSLAGEPLEGAEVTLALRTERGGAAAGLSTADGSFAIAGIPAGARAQLVVRSPGKPQLETPHFVTAPDMDVGELVLEDGLSVGGIVVGASGKALSRSRVHLSVHGGEHWTCCERSGRADGEGRFAFDGLRPGTYRVEASADGYLRARGAELTLAFGEAPPDVRVVLGEGGVITGRVLSPEGIPEPGAKVVWKWREDSARAFTDAGGRFSIAGLGDEELELQASRGSRASRSAVARAGDSIDLVLGRRAALEGSVRDRATGEPVGEFQVFVGDGSGRSRGRGQTFIEPSGRFVLEDLEPGDRAVRIFAKGYLCHETRMALEPGTRASLDAELERGGAITGRLSDARGQPISGARVFTVSEEEAERERASGTMTTYMTAPDGVTTATTHDSGLPDETISGSQGLFALEGLAGGATILRVEHPQYLRRVLRGIDPPAQGTLDLGDIRLEMGAALEGTVVNARGKPVRGGTVHIQRMGPDGPIDTKLYTPIGKDGAYRKSGLEPGRAWISVFGAGATGREVELEPGATLRADFRLPRD